MKTKKKFDGRKGGTEVLSSWRQGRYRQVILEAEVGIARRATGQPSL